MHEPAHDIEPDSTSAALEPDPLFEEYTYPSMFGDAEVFTLETEDGTPIRALYVAGGFQSATFLGPQRFEPVFAYYRAIDRVFDAADASNMPIERMLMIGGGAFSYPKHLLTSTDPRLQAASIDVVEIDPAIVDIARKHFFLDEIEAAHGPSGTGRLGIIVDDGAHALEASQPGTCNVVVNDSFDGTDPTGGLLFANALLAAKRAMTPGGFYLINAVLDEPGSELVFARTLRQAFKNVYLVACEDEDFAGSENTILVATDSEITAPEFLAL